MKKLLIAFTICFLTVLVNNSYAQTSANGIKTDALKNTTAQTKQDSVQLKQEEINAFVEKVITSTTIKDLQLWCYKTMTAEKFDDFKLLYQAFLQQKFEEWVQQQKKK